MFLLDISVMFENKEEYTHKWDNSAIVSQNTDFFASNHLWNRDNYTKTK